MRFMHVGYDAAECHHHILGYLKIDFPAFVFMCVRARVCRAHSHRPAVVVYCPFLHASWLFLVQLLQRKEWS